MAGVSEGEFDRMIRVLTDSIERVDTQAQARREN